MFDISKIFAIIKIKGILKDCEAKKRIIAKIFFYFLYTDFNQEFIENKV